MINSRFHRLLVVEELAPLRYTRTFVRQYRCICDCGAEIVAQRPNLLRGGTKSCGCWKKESAGQHAITHHMSRSSEYKIWAGIRKRCLNFKYREFHLYGGRGIQICDRWSDFAAFYADMGPRPTPQHSIDRINNDGNYEPGNCRWASKVEQGFNTRKSIKVNYNGEEMTLRQFAKAVDHSYSSIYDWFVRRNMPFDAVLKKLQLPVKNRH